MVRTLGGAEVLGEAHPGALGIQNPFLWAPLEVWTSLVAADDMELFGTMVGFFGSIAALLGASLGSRSSSRRCDVAVRISLVPVPTHGFVGVGPWSVRSRSSSRR